MKTETLTKCPVCGEFRLENLFLCKDYSITGEEFMIQECKGCTLKLTNPRPLEEEIGRYYQSEEYISHSNTNKGVINKLYHQVRKITLREKLRLINDLAPKSNLLDIGCGTGYFLKTCKDNGWNVEGTEPDPQARKLAEEITGRKIHSSVFEIEQEKRFDIITLWHVVEHIHKLNETFTKISELLKEKGRVVIAVPNPESWDAIHYHQYWAAYDVPRHLYHFTQQSMITLLNNHKFKLLEILPMKFDAYYVSMMSERYQSGNKSPHLIKSFLRGLKSNIYAKNNNKNYSSLIYIGEKN